MYLSGPDLDFAGDFYADEFLPAYTEVSGEDAPISVFHAHAFDAYNMLADAIEAVAFDEDGTTVHPAHGAAGRLLRHQWLRGHHRHPDVR